MTRGQGQVAGTEAAAEFARQAQALITEPGLEGVAADLLAKSRLFQDALDRGVLRDVSAERLRACLRTIFAARRRAGALLSEGGVDAWRSALWDLLHGAGPVAARVDAFDAALAGVDPGIRLDVAGEVLHFFDPSRHWLWTRWIWDPGTGTGALSLATPEELDLSAASAGQSYLRVGEGIAFVERTAVAAGITRFGPAPFGVDVFLAAVYAAHLYTVTGTAMSREFNAVLPPAPELVRRLLGVQRRGA
ncbi:MAG: hypothetical protein ABSA40_10405 [Candidatus Dormibacteria bacterium]|jgi:hypothetical protein